MTATTTLAGGVSGDGAPPASFHGADWLLEEMNRQARADIPNLDNVSDGTGPDWDGDRCGECGTPVPDDGRLCDDCREPDGEPHPYPCPTCGGNDCRACGDTGELVEWSR